MLGLCYLVTALQCRTLPWCSVFDQLCNCTGKWFLAALLNCTQPTGTGSCWWCSNKSSTQATATRSCCSWWCSSTWCSWSCHWCLLILVLHFDLLFLLSWQYVKTICLFTVSSGLLSLVVLTDWGGLRLGLKVELFPGQLLSNYFYFYALLLPL